MGESELDYFFVFELNIVEGEEADEFGIEGLVSEFELLLKLC